jgi:zinc transporter ZupT
VLVLLARPNAWNSLVLIVISYVLSQVPYGFALTRTRRGLDRLGIAVAFAASCVLVVEGLLPFVHLPGVLTTRFGFLGWPSLFLMAHAVVAVFAWRAGKLAPPEGDDMALIAGSFVGVVVYVIFVRFFEMHFIRIFLR